MTRATILLLAVSSALFVAPTSTAQEGALHAHYEDVEPDPFHPMRNYQLVVDGAFYVSDGADELWMITFAVIEGPIAEEPVQAETCLMRGSVARGFLTDACSSGSFPTISGTNDPRETLNVPWLDYEGILIEYDDVTWTTSARIT